MEGTNGINIGKHKIPGSRLPIATALANVLQEGFSGIILTDDWETANGNRIRNCNSFHNLKTQMNTLLHACVKENPHSNGVRQQWQYTPLSSTIKLTAGYVSTLKVQSLKIHVTILHSQDT